LSSAALLCVVLPLPQFLLLLPLHPTSLFPIPHFCHPPFVARKRSRARILACQQLGVPDSLVFDTTDLHSAKDINAVVSCIYALAAATPSTPDLLSEEAERARSARRS
jgi:hypothetical protein